MWSAVSEHEIRGSNACPAIVISGLDATGLILLI